MRGYPCKRVGTDRENCRFGNTMGDARRGLRLMVPQLARLAAIRVSMSSGICTFAGQAGVVAALRESRRLLSTGANAYHT